MPGFPKEKPPANRVALERWITQKADEEGIAATRLRRALSFMVLSAVLTRFTDEEGAPLFLLKGGVAMELRVGARARASRDFDTAFRDDMSRLEEILAAASVHEHGIFRLTAGSASPIGPTGAVRIPVRIALAHYDWGTVDLEVSPAEGGSRAATGIEYAEPAPALSVFGLPDGARVPLFPLPYQVAQKLHACTEVREDRDNDRFRDLIDLLLLEEILAEPDLPAVRLACEEVFRLRGRHAWPPEIRLYPLWADGYRNLALGMGFPVAEVSDATVAVSDFVARIAAAPSGA
ncbi:MAG: nucleotidyl transferase AbiEii/AbiGii toxin family protein [Chloroflexota bacterium]